MTNEPTFDHLDDLFEKHGHPGEPDYHNNKGMLCRTRGDLEGAIREYREAIRLRPFEAMYHSNLGSALAERGDPVAALHEYQMALDLSPCDYATHLNLGNLYSRMDRIAETEAAYRETIAADPEQAMAHYGLAGCCWDQGRQEEAVEQYRQALALDPRAPAAVLARLRLGYRAQEEARWQEAEEHLLAALQVQEDAFLSHYGLAVLYLEMPDSGEGPAWVYPAKALVHIRQALELEPGEPDALEVARAALEAFERTKPSE